MNPRQVEPRLPAGGSSFPHTVRSHAVSLRTYILGACVLIVAVAWILAVARKGGNR